MNAPTPRSALVVVAHPDDCEFSCGGTIAKWCAASCDISLVVLTDGTLGSHDVRIGARKLADVREDEQRRGAKTLGIQRLQFWAQADGHLQATAELIERLAGTVRALRPEVVMAHDPWRHHQFHPDHIAAGNLVMAALYRSREPRVSVSFEGVERRAWSPTGAWLFGAQDVNHVEAVESHLEQKLAAILCHESQAPTSMGFEIGDDEGKQQFMEKVRARAAAAGSPAGIAAGEEFHVIEL
jgi:LmbE family N-acetylglucosaminyl deacetylase